MERWLLIDVMHAGGATLRAMLEARLGGAVYPTRAEIEAGAYGWYEPAAILFNRIEDGRLDLSGRRILCGNYAARITEMLPGTWRTAIILREPVERTRALLAKFERREKRAKNLWRVRHDLGNEEFVETQIRDYQTKILCMHGASDVNTARRVDADALEAAKARLDRFDFVGLAEDFPAAVRGLGERLGIALPAEGAVAETGPLAEASAAQIATIRDLVRHDIALYEHARLRAREGAALPA